MSLEDFKKVKNVQSIEVKENPKTRKLFFVYGVDTGAVSSNYKPGEPSNDVISWVENEHGEDFFLLHNRDDGSTKTISTL